MKPNQLILTVLVVVCVLLLQAGCEEEAMAPREISPDWFQQQTQMATTRTPSFAKSSSRITFEKVTHNFGDVGPGTNHLCEFRFTNTGEGVLKISQVDKTCGCTPFSLNKTEYAPGESGTLRVRYYAELEQGSTTKQLFVHSNDRQNPKVALAIKARVAAKVKSEPSTLSLSLKHQNAGCPQITLTSLDNQPFSISSFKSTANCVTAAYNPSAKATRFVLQPKVDMAKLEKTLNGRIEIGLTHPECKTLTIGLNALPRFSVAPRPIVVHSAQAKTPVTRKVRIQNNYKDDFELESVYSKNGTVKVLSNTRLIDGYELDLSITPPDTLNTTGVFTDVVYVKVKGGRNLEIPCSGFYSRPDAVSRAPSRASSRASTRSTSTNKKDCPTCGPKRLYFGPTEK
ncbi:MAG TPA: DUF1573 domain-containing protein [Sedimentisphaerales bacterium]|nr:DUF1573 domain-containing protein [Sedimentisphaerales bacterium]